MQTNNQVLRAMVESEEVSLQATAEVREGFCCSKWDRKVIPQFRGQPLDISTALRHYYNVVQQEQQSACRQLSTKGLQETPWSPIASHVSSNKAEDVTVHLLLSGLSTGEDRHYLASKLLNHLFGLGHIWTTGGPGARCGPHLHLMRPPAG